MEDTQWNDVLRQKGIIPPKSKEAEVTEEQIEDMVENVVKTYTSNGKLHFKKQIFFSIILINYCM
jgi:hypothetical protein